MGPVEEFMTNEKGLGYDEVAAGGEFIRIGVGAVRKPEEQRYERFKTYDIVDNGKWKVNKGKDWIEFTQDLGDHNGYSYRYTKRISLPKGESQMVIDHRLKNTGRKRSDAAVQPQFLRPGRPADRSRRVGSIRIRVEALVADSG